jgi:6-phosphogluconolactonase
MMDFIVNCKIDISENIEELSDKFAQLLFEDTVHKKDYYTVALSGGSTPKAVFKHLAEKYSERIDWKKIKFFWGDERCVSPTDSESNYKMAFDNLLSKVIVPKENIFRIHGEMEPNAEAINYSRIIKAQVPSFNNIPCFDMILLGLGEDGHTASIFPNQLELFSSNELCAVAEHQTTKQKRITLTGKVINNAAKIIFLVTGNGKKEIVDAIINRRDGSEKLPAFLVKSTNGELIWMLDEAASTLLNH